MAGDNTDEARASPNLIVNRAELAAALTRLRESAGLSIRQLAHAIDQPAGTIGGYLSGRHLPSAAHTEPLVAVLRGCGVGEGQEQAWLDAVQRIRQAPGPRAVDQRSPYPGLEPFGYEDARVFFGRAQVSAELSQLIAGSREQEHSPFVIVSGTSGAGKSSLLRAGALAPLTFVEDTIPVVFSPGAQPRAALGAALREAASWPPNDVGDDGAARRYDAAAEAMLEARPDAIDQFLGDAQHLLIGIDQAEQLFAPDMCAETRDKFFRSALRLADLARPDGRRYCTFVVVLRSQVLAVAEQTAPLRDALQRAHIRVPSLTTNELSTAITGPAGTVGIHVEDELVQVLLADMAPHDVPDQVYDDGALPWLAQALRETWNISRRGRMTVRDYHAAGVIAERIGQAAESFWSMLDDADRSLMRLILLRLVLVDDEFVVTRRSTLRVELEDLMDFDAANRYGLAASTGADTSCMVDSLVEARIVTARRDTIDISHPALLTAWPRLTSWIDADRGNLRQYRRVTEAAQAWRQHSREPSYLLRGRYLSVVEEWITDGSMRLTRVGQEFIDACIAERVIRQRVERRRRGQLQIALVLVAALALAAGTLAVFALHNSAVANRRAAEAVQARNGAQSRELAISAARLRGTDPAMAAQLSMVAYQIAHTVNARSALLDSTAAPTPTRIPAQAGPTSVALNLGSRTLAVTNAKDGSVSLWSLDRPERPALLTTIPSAEPDVQQFSAAISPDGRQLVVGNADGLVQRWDISDPAHPVFLNGPGTVFPSGVLTLAFSPDGGTLAAGGAGGAVQRWDVMDPTSVSALPSLPASSIVGAVAYSPDGSTLWAGGDDGTLRAWPVGSLRDSTPGLTAPAGRSSRAGTPENLTVGDSQINTVALSPDGAMLVTGDKDGAVTVWRRHLGQWSQIDDAVAPMQGWASTAAFNADGSLLALGSTQNQLEVLSTVDFSVVMAVDNPGPVTSVVFDGPRSVIAAATDGYARVWPVPGPTIGPVGSTIFGVGIAAPGRLLVSSRAPANKLLSYDMTDRVRPFLVADVELGDDDVSLDGSFALSEDGRLAATGTADGRVQLWDVSDVASPAPVGRPIPAITDIVQAVAFSPDGTVLAVGGDDQRLSLWDISDSSAPKELNTTGDVGGQIYQMSFQPGGSLLAAGTTAGDVIVWDVSDASRPRRTATLRESGGYIFGVAFSPDGAILAAAGADREVYLWDVSDPSAPAKLTDPLTGPANQINAVTFSHDGSLLAASTFDGVVWLWDITNPALPVLWARLRGAPGALYAVAFSPDDSRLVAAGSDQRVTDWLVDANTAEQALCAAQGAGVSESEWRMYVSARQYSAPCEA